MSIKLNSLAESLVKLANIYYLLNFNKIAQDMSEDEAFKLLRLNKDTSTVDDIKQRRVDLAELYHPDKIAPVSETFSQEKRDLKVKEYTEKLAKFNRAADIATAFKEKGSAESVESSSEDEEKVPLKKSVVQEIRFLFPVFERIQSAISDKINKAPELFVNLKNIYNLITILNSCLNTLETVSPGYVQLKEIKNNLEKSLGDLGDIFNQNPILKNKFLNLLSPRILNLGNILSEIDDELESAVRDNKEDASSDLIQKFLDDEKAGKYHSIIVKDELVQPGTEEISNIIYQTEEEEEEEPGLVLKPKTKEEETSEYIRNELFGGYTAGLSKKDVSGLAAIDAADNNQTAAAIIQSGLTGFRTKAPLTLMQAIKNYRDGVHDVPGDLSGIKHRTSISDKIKFANELLTKTSDEKEREKIKNYQNKLEKQLSFINDEYLIAAERKEISEDALSSIFNKGLGYLQSGAGKNKLEEIINSATDFKFLNEKEEDLRRLSDPESKKLLEIVLNIKKEIKERDAKGGLKDQFKELKEKFFNICIEVRNAAQAALIGFNSTITNKENVKELLGEEYYSKLEKLQEVYESTKRATLSALREGETGTKYYGSSKKLFNKTIKKIIFDLNSFNFRKTTPEKEANIATYKSQIDMCYELLGKMEEETKKYKERERVKTRETEKIKKINLDDLIKEVKMTSQETSSEKINELFKLGLPELIKKSKEGASSSVTTLVDNIAKDTMNPRYKDKVIDDLQPQYNEVYKRLWEKRDPTKKIEKEKTKKGAYIEQWAEIIKNNILSIEGEILTETANRVIALREISEIGKATKSSSNPPDYWKNNTQTMPNLFNQANFADPKGFVPNLINTFNVAVGLSPISMTSPVRSVISQLPTPTVTAPSPISAAPITETPPTPEPIAPTPSAPTEKTEKEIKQETNKLTTRIISYISQNKSKSIEEIYQALEAECPEYLREILFEKINKINKINK